MLGKVLFNLHQYEGAEGGDCGNASHDSGNQSAEVVYGKQAQEDNQDESHYADDKGDEEQSRRERFDSLVKNEYKDLFDERVRENIDRRFKNSRKAEEELSRANAALMPLYERYGINEGDFEALDEAIRGDGALLEEEAARLGMTPEQYAYARNAELDAKKAYAELEKVRGAQQAQQTYQTWMAESEALKDSYPDFDLANELQNERFSGLLKQGWNVAEAYEAIHARELIQNGMGTAAAQARQNVLNNIRSRSTRASENGATARPGVIVKKDPSQFDNKDLEEVCRQVKDGKKIVF